jgi:hypothetical protein
MKVKIEFNLPEETEEYKIYSQSREMHGLLVEIQEVWSLWKDSEEEPSGQEVLGYIQELIKESDVVIY